MLAQSIVARGSALVIKSRLALETLHPPPPDGSRPDDEDVSPNDAVQRPRRTELSPHYKSHRGRTDHEAINQ